MRKNLVGQTSKQKRNCEEQKRRRASIKEGFPKTVTFHTYEKIVDKITEKQNEIAKAFEIARENIRQVEVKSLAITYYIYTQGNRDKKKVLMYIYKKVTKENMTLAKLLKSLDNKYPLEKNKWDRKTLLDYLFFRI